MNKCTLSNQLMKFKNDFPLLKSCTYFNTAYVGLMSESLYNFRVNFERDYLNNGDLYKLKAYDNLPSTQESIASFIGSNRDQTFFVSNFSTGIRYVLDSLSSQANLLYIKNDYHSLVSAIEERQFNLFPIEMSENVEAAVEKTLSVDKIDVLVISMVQYTNGLLIDFDFLAELRNKYPHLIIIGDATQYIGTDLFNFSDSPFDAVVCSGYKWLLAGFGNGFVALNDDFFAKTQTTAEQFAEKVYTGHFNILGAASLVFALDVLMANDFEKLVQANNKLCGELRATLRKNGFQPVCGNRKKHSTIISIPYDEDLLKLMGDQRISVAHRGDFIRFSVHFYNTSEDIETLVKVIKKAAIV